MNKSLKLKKKLKWKTADLLKRAKTTEKEGKKVSKALCFCYTRTFIKPFRKEGKEKKIREKIP